VNHPAQHQVLFVDDDGDFLETVRDLFGTLSGQTWQIHLATTTDRALEILKEGQIELAVVDINMPVLDGLQFIAILQRRYPKLKRAILTAYASEEKRSASLANGADLFIEKPRTADGLKSVFAMLGELLQYKADGGFQGVLRRVGLSDVIQMECLARNSSILEIYNQHVIGRIYIEDGQLIHAAGGDLVGELALQKLLSLPGGSFELAQFEAPPELTLNGPWEFLLMEAARMRDEMAANGQTGGIEVDPQTLTAPTDTSAARLEETLICSGSGELLYEAQCADAAARVGWLQAVAQQAAQLGGVLALGDFDRLEISLADGRAVVSSRTGRLVYVRVSNTLGNA
jgi:CheY-like chemotaxis protein